VPVSALGHAPKESSIGPVVRPIDVKPTWVTVPILYALCRWAKGLIGSTKRAAAPAPLPATPTRAFAADAGDVDAGGWRRRRRPAAEQQQQAPAKPPPVPPDEAEWWKPD